MRLVRQMASCLGYLVASAAVAIAPSTPPDAALCQATDFDEWSTGNTLRFDYFHSGTAQEEQFSLDAFRLENDWSGSRTRLVDPLGFGEYRFEVVDAADGTVLYSRGFDSIFGEWKTTAEARELRRTFQESQRFPEPRRDVRLELKRIQDDGSWRSVYAVPFRRATDEVNRAAPAHRGDMWAVFQSGESASRLDLLVLAEGYTAGERDKFREDTLRLTGVLFDIEPFRSRKSDFNVWAVHIAAPEPGISDPRRGRWLNSPLGFRSNAFGIDRYALSFDNRAIREAAAAAPYDALVIIWNGTKHAGGGIYNLWAVAPSDSPTSPYVFVHELGHSLAGLADEYYSASVAYELSDNIAEPTSPNATALGDPAKLKWRDLVEPATPLPTPWNQSEYDRLASDHQARIRALEGREATPDELNQVYAELKKAAGPLFASEKYSDKVGAFEGASYRAKGLYRPEVDCIMFSHNRGAFCRVCRRAIEQAIDLYTE